ncbi:serine protease [Pseudoroseomonas globiformis]|uniref:Serine protease n=1 Tax=Teichococcus globiformis TaxID=2307229 RepID=A0ABV7G3K4_9PROT
MRKRLGLLLTAIGIIGGPMLAGAVWHGLATPTALRAEPASGLSGSGFLVAPGLLVTNAHVALRCRAEGRAIMTDHPDKAAVWRILAEDAGTDLALLAGPMGHESTLLLSAATRLPAGMPVMLLSYPATGPANGGLQARTGRIGRAALTVHDPQAGRAVSFTVTDRDGREVAAQWEDGLRYFGDSQAEKLRWQVEIDAPSGGGSSGGPVLDAQGGVVAVIYAGAGGRTSAVPLSDLREFLARAGVMPNFRPPAGNRTPDWPKVLEDAHHATRRLTC